MKKGYLFLSILLFLASGVAFAFAVDRFSAAARYYQSMDRSMKSMGKETDMAKMESAHTWMELDAEMASKAKHLGLTGAGGGLVLLICSVVLLTKRK